MNQVRIFALGGLDEDGKNMYVVEVGQSIFVIEAGLKYPDNDQHGIEMIIPDVRYLVENKHRVKGIFITHGHDDVMAAIANLVRQVNAPIYTAPLTALLIEDELKKNGATSDGFVHNPASFTCTLFNGAEINTLNSDITNIKGKRANLVCFDEAGWISDELFVQAENFVNQDENFKLGGNVDITLEPKGLPRQLLYASSASDTSSEYYKKFRYFSERMLMGDQ